MGSRLWLREGLHGVSHRSAAASSRTTGHISYSSSDSGDNRSRDNSAQTTHSSKNSAVWVCPVHSPQTNGAILVFCKPPIRFICTFHTYQRFYITSVSDYMWVWAGCRVRRTVEAEPETTALHAVLTCVNLKPLDQTSFSNRVCGDRNRYFWGDIWKTCSWKPGTFGTFCMNRS